MLGKLHDLFEIFTEGVAVHVVDEEMSAPPSVATGLSSSGHSEVLRRIEYPLLSAGEEQ